MRIKGMKENNNSQNVLQVKRMTNKQNSNNKLSEINKNKNINNNYNSNKIFKK